MGASTRLGVTAFAACLIPALAFAGGQSRQTAELNLGATQPGESTGQHLLVDYRNPGDPEGKPPAVRKVVTVLPGGARFDTSVPGSCTASDAELMAEGAAACAEDSAIGGGVVTIDTGVPGPERFATADVEFFNNDADHHGELIFLNTVRDTEARTVIRADVRKRKTVTHAPMLPGTPPDGGAIDTVDVHLASVESGAHAYVTTPPHCPASGKWRTMVRFTYADEVTQTVRDTTPCGS